VPPMFGRQDASYGTLLLGRGGGRFEAADAARAGVAIEGQVREIRRARRADGGALLLVARNDDTLLALRPTGRPAAGKTVAARTTPTRPR
jgi:enediyne biosynthesis protein E4